jgi:Ca2+:H+ antiporter
MIKGLRWLLLFLPVANITQFFHAGDLAVFATSALAIVPLAGILGEATEVLAEKSGPRIGGLLNASFGNAAELIIALVAINSGQLELVKASLTGSILGNLLVVLGFSMFLGGIKNGIQTFNRRHAGTGATMTILAVITMIVPSLFSLYIEPDKIRVEELSLSTAAIILILYVLFIVFTLKSCKDESCETKAAAEPVFGHRWSPRKALIVMGVSMMGIALMSEFLVESVEAATELLGLTPFFVE